MQSKPEFAAYFIEKLGLAMLRHAGDIAGYKRDCYFASEFVVVLERDQVGIGVSSWAFQWCETFDARAQHI